MKTTEFLSNTLLFQGLPAEELAALARIAIVRRYDKGQVIFLEGDPGSGFFVIREGRVKVFKLSPEGKEQILHIFSAGENFAEVSAFDGGCFPASATAIEDAVLLLFPCTAFKELLSQQPNLAINMLAILARHLRRFALLIDQLSLQQVPQRLANYLLASTERMGNSATLELDLSKGQLAALLGTIPETLSRAFYKLSGDGLIAISGAQIRILDRQRLLALGTGKDI